MSDEEGPEDDLGSARGAQDWVDLGGEGSGVGLGVPDGQGGGSTGGAKSAHKMKQSPDPCPQSQSLL